MNNKLLYLICFFMFVSVGVVESTYIDSNFTLKVIPTVSIVTAFDSNGSAYNETYWNFSTIIITTESETFEYNITMTSNLDEDLNMILWRELTCEESDLLNISRLLINLTMNVTGQQRDCYAIYKTNGRLSAALMSCSKELNPLCYNESEKYDRCFSTKASQDAEVNRLGEENETCNNSKIWYALIAGVGVLIITYSMWKKPQSPAKHPEQKDFPGFPG